MNYRKGNLTSVVPFLLMLTLTYYSVGSTPKFNGFVNVIFGVLGSINAVALMLVVDEAIAHEAGGWYLGRLALQTGRNLERGCCAGRNDEPYVEGLFRQVPIHRYIAVRSGFHSTDEANSVCHLGPYVEVAICW